MNYTEYFAALPDERLVREWQALDRHTPYADPDRQARWSAVNREIANRRIEGLILP